jgi:hypothetical protein
MDIHISIRSYYSAIFDYIRNRLIFYYFFPRPDISRQGAPKIHFYIFVVLVGFSVSTICSKFNAYVDFHISIERCFRYFFLMNRLLTIPVGQRTWNRRPDNRSIWLLISRPKNFHFVKSALQTVNSVRTIFLQQILIRIVNCIHLAPRLVYTAIDSAIFIYIFLLPA